MKLINLSGLIASHAGRPKKGSEQTREKMSTRTVKLPDSHWEVFDKKCEELNLTEHEALRMAVLQFTYPVEDNPELYAAPDSPKQ